MRNRRGDAIEVAVDAAVEFGPAQSFLDRLGGIGGELDDLDQPPGGVAHRVIGGLDVDFSPALADALVLGLLEFATTECLPERAVGGAPTLGSANEHRVMLALHLVEAKADHRQEVGVCSNDGAVEGELDDALRAVKGVELALIVGVAQLLRGDVGRALEHAVGFAVTAHKRVVASLDPDLPAALADALVLSDLMLAAAQSVPELAVCVTLALGRIDEHGVVLATDLLQPVTQGCQEVGVGRDDLAVEVELDQRLRDVKRIQLSLEFTIELYHLIYLR